MVTQTDDAGNEDRDDATFNKDITAPTIAVTSSRKVNRAGQSDVDLTGSCSEQGRKVGITIGSGSKVEVDCTATGWVYENLDLSDPSDYPEGIITLTITHRDQTGNENSMSNASTQLSKDITPPTLSVSSQPLPTINIENATGYTFSGDCAGSDGNSVIVTISSFSTNLNATCEQEWEILSGDLSLLADSSSISVTIRVEDGHGNPTTVSASVAKDTVAPTVSIDSLTEVIESTDLENYAVAGDCSEDTVSVVVDASGVVPTTQPVCGAGRWSTTLDISDLGGIVHFSALQTDAAGNHGRAAERTIELDAVRLVGKILSKLDLGDRHSCAVTDNGKALCWGKGTDGQLGNSLIVSQDTPVYVVDGDSSITPMEGIVQIATGESHSCVLNIEGKVFCWGIQNEGQLGNGVTSNTATVNYPATV